MAVRNAMRGYAMVSFIPACSYRTALPSSPCEGTSSCRSKPVRSRRYFKPMKIGRLKSAAVGRTSMSGTPLKKHTLSG
jgi:hypothetical protein